MEKVQTIYSFGSFNIIVNEEYPHISIVDYGKANSGFLKHWDSPDDLIKELNKAIEAIQKVKEEMRKTHSYKKMITE